MKRLCGLGVLGWVLWGAAATAATLTGVWTAAITLDPQQPVLTDGLRLDTTVHVVYTVSPWTFASASRLQETGWTEQQFLATGDLGPFGLASTMTFDPTVPAFQSWEAILGVDLLLGELKASFTLVDSDARLVLSGESWMDEFLAGVEVSLGEEGNGVCDFHWVDLVVWFGLSFGCAEVRATTTLDPSGFVALVVDLAGAPFPHLPHLLFDLSVTYAVAGKSLAMTPRVDGGTWSCFELYAELEWSGGHAPDDPLIIEGVTIDGFGLRCDVGEVSFSALSYWGDAPKPGRLLDTPYWEVYTIQTTQEACCGPFAYELSVYFLEDGIRLFDVALIDSTVSLRVSPNVRLFMAVELDIEAATFSEWVIGFEITW